MIKWHQLNCYHEWAVKHKYGSGIFTAGRTMYQCKKCKLTKKTYGDSF